MAMKKTIRRNQPASREKFNTSTIRGLSRQAECHLDLGDVEVTLHTSRVESLRNHYFQCRLVEARPIREFRRSMNALAEALDSTKHIYKTLGE